MRAAWRLALMVLLSAVAPRARAVDAAPHVLLLDATRAGDDVVVAVGERGTVFRSTDQGRTWSPASSGTGTTLTGVAFADARHGWAVGHDGLILASLDGGASWRKTWQSEALTDSFLDVLAIDATHVIAIGAYGLYVSTVDGGKTWTRRKLRPDDFHLNRISRGPSGTLYLAGEHGTVLRSDDAGAQWTSLTLPYDGSFYGILPLGPRTLVAHGLRGRAFVSSDDGATWRELATSTTSLLATAVALPGGALALAGQARALLLAASLSQPVQRREGLVDTGVAELVLLRDGALLAVGEAGPTRIDPARLGLNAASSAASP